MTNTLAAADVSASRPGKVFYPETGITKGEVFEYYRSVADQILPHLWNRPLTLRRYPDGINGENFFQKDASGYFPDWVSTYRVPKKSSSGATHYVLCQDLDTLLYLVNQAVLEFHVWTTTADSPDRPDRMVVDLDPPENGTVAALRKAATGVRRRLGDLDLAAYPQTTGGRGYHIVTPLDGAADQELVRDLARAVADGLADESEGTLTTQQYKDKRGDAIFLDTNRNGAQQTWICPYSLRGRPGAPAATPIDWKELSRTAPADHGLRDVPRRLSQKSDPWRRMNGDAGSAKAAAKALGVR